MSCVRLLRTDFNNTADTGGRWRYIGYDNNSGTEENWSDTPAIPLVGVAAGSIYMSGNDNPAINTGTATPGYYAFDYEMVNGPCVNTARIVIQVTNAPCPGGTDTFDYCSDASSVNLATLWQTASACGTMTIGTITNPTSPTGVDGSVFGASYPYTFDPGANDAGTHVITNTTSPMSAPGFDLDETCADCYKSASITINITAALDPGDAKYSPYLSVCPDPNCTVNFGGLLENFDPAPATLLGDWEYDGPITEQFSVNGNAYNTYTAGSVLIDGNMTGSVNFSQGNPGTIYDFTYVTSPGTDCERTESISIYLGPIPNAGTAPSWTTPACWYNFLSAALGNNTSINLWNLLGGSPSTQGTWSVTITNSNISSLWTTPALNAAWAQGVTSPTATNSGIDDTFNFATFFSMAGLNGVATSVTDYYRFNFSYTAALPGTYLCAQCAPQTVSWYVDVCYSVTTGSTSYSTSGTAYQCYNCIINPYTLLSGAMIGGNWRVGSTGINQLEFVELGIGPNNYAANSQITGSSNAQPERSQPTLNFSDVPAGTYQLIYYGGGFTSCGNCSQSTTIYIQVIEPCGVSVSISTT